MVTACWSTQRVCSDSKLKQGTVHTASKPIAVGRTPQSASSVENEELQAPTMSGIEKPLTKDTHVDNAPENPPGSQSETMVNSPATPLCRCYPLRLRKPPERLTL